MTALLEIADICKVFGGLTALDGVSFTLASGQILGLVGPNGSGKSTLLNVLSGIYTPEAGEVRLAGQSLRGRAPHQIAKAGLARSFQNQQLFAGLSVVDNVLVGRACRLQAGVLASIFGGLAFRREEAAARQQAVDLLTLVGLGWAAEAEVQRLSYGQRRLLEIARALASDPKVLLLDEPCAGLSQAEADDLAVVITRLKTQGLAVIVIEHNMRFVMGLVDRIVALNFGQKIGEGTPAEIRANPAVVAAYLGGSSRAAH